MIMYTQKIFKFVMLILFIPFIKLPAQDNSFVFQTDSFKNYTPTYIGNGFFSLSSTLLGADQAESFMAGVFDEVPGDIPRIAELPAWNEVDILNEDSWLSNEQNNFEHISSYSQELNMFNGELTTSFTYDVNNRKIIVRIVSFVSRANKNLAIIKCSVTPLFNGTIEIKFPIEERKEPQRLEMAKLKKISSWPDTEWPPIWYPGFVKLDYKDISSKQRLIHAFGTLMGRKYAINITGFIGWDGIIDNLKIEGSHSSKKAQLTLKFPGEIGKQFTFYKYIYITKSQRGKKIFDDDVLKKIAARGYETNRKQNEDAWSQLWKTDIIAEGNPDFQKIIHTMMYYLLSSTYKNSDFSVGPMGLATSGYCGHVFWDADTYMFPPMLLMHPRIAKTMAMFRYHALDSALKNAKKNGYKGAMYPWESDEIGNESTPFFAYQNALKENHIVGDVAIAQWQYFLATNDTSWLRNYGSKVIDQTSNFWVSRVKYNKPKGRYEIADVVSVSEGLIGVHNETYTNSVAKMNMEIADKVSDIIKSPKNPDWKKVAEKMFIPFNAEKKFNPTFENAGAGEGATELWSSVTPLLTYPLQIKMSEEVKENNLLHAVNNLKKDGAGADMGVNFLPIIAAEVGNDSLFNLIINKTVAGFLRPPYNVITETQKNVNYNFITGAGAFLQQVIFGYTGLRITDEGLVAKYKPMLPAGITKLILRNFKFRNQTFIFVVENGKLTTIKK
jgi:trehalose/maltose hydrolase-like predicted phosphorylase